MGVTVLMAESRRITYYLGLTDKLESEQNLSDGELSSVLLCDVSRYFPRNLKV